MFHKGNKYKENFICNSTRLNMKGPSVNIHFPLKYIQHEKIFGISAEVKVYTLLLRSQPRCMEFCCFCFLCETDTRASTGNRPKAWKVASQLTEMQKVIPCGQYLHMNF